MQNSSSNFFKYQGKLISWHQSPVFFTLRFILSRLCNHWRRYCNSRPV